MLLSFIKKYLITIMTYQTSSQVDQSQAFNCSGCPNFTSFNGSRGRGLCTYHNQVVFEHHQSTNECLFSLEKESANYLQSFDQPEDVPPMRVSTRTIS